jgi:hypothetical protein
MSAISIVAANPDFDSESDAGPTVIGDERPSANWGKADRRGRSSGKLRHKKRKLIAPPKGEAWTWQTAELLASAAWHGMSINCRRLIDFLLIEHCGHAGLENGHLKAPYDDLVAFGIRRQSIRPTIAEAVRRGLIRITKHGGRLGIERALVPSEYRLTWIGTLKPECEGTNDWKRFTEAPEKHFPSTGSGTAGERQL